MATPVTLQLRVGEDVKSQISASVVIVSQHLSQDQDLDTNTPTMERSRRIVKNIELVFDPPLQLNREMWCLPYCISANLV